MLSTLQNIMKTIRHPLPRGWHRLLLLAFLISCTPLLSQDQRSPEARRLGDREFCKGLQDRGLVDLLESYLQEYPVGDPVEGLLLRRSLLLARYEDQSRSLEERQEALAQADMILDRLIDEYPADLRIYDWRMERAKSILYTHARPYYEQVLYWGGNPTAYEKLQSLASQAIQELNLLSQAIEIEYDRVDDLPPLQYDRLEHDGHIDKLERLAGESDYIRWWAIYYRNISRKINDENTNSELQDLLTVLNSPSGALQTNHSISRIQAQSLLLAEMAARQLSRPVEAIGYYNRLEHLYRYKLDPTEQRKLSWVMTLGLLERARSLADSNEYSQAREAIKILGEHCKQVTPDHFGMKLLVAMAFRDTCKKESDTLRRLGKDAESQKTRLESTEQLEALARSYPRQKDEIYNVLSGILDHNTPIEQLPPFEQCAKLASLLHEAITGKQSFQAVIQTGDQLLAQNLPDRMKAEVIYNVAVAQLHTHNNRRAAELFLEIARNHPDFYLSENAATQAAHIASDLYFEGSKAPHLQHRSLYRDALETLISNYPGAQGTHYWRFYLAQVLEEDGEPDRAAEMYRLVGPEHEYATEARFGIIRCRANALKDRIASEVQPRPGESREIAHRLLFDADKIAKLILKKRNHTTDSQERRRLSTLAAKVLIIKGEVQVLKSVDLYREALDTLKDFEEDYPRTGNLMGRVLRVRLLAYEGLGQLEEAEQLIPQYLQSDPENAGPTLQQLLVTIQSETERLEKLGRRNDVQEKRLAAAILARQIYDWSASHSPRLPKEQIYALRIQLADTLLAANKIKEAQTLFKECLDENAEENEDQQAHDLRAVKGLAETMYLQADFEEALPLFNRIVLSIEKNTPDWWHSLLRELQCRTELGNPPDGILRVISQYSHLFPEMGGQEYRREFQALRTKNEKRQKSN